MKVSRLLLPIVVAGLGFLIGENLGWRGGRGDRAAAAWTASTESGTAAPVRDAPADSLRSEDDHARAGPVPGVRVETASKPSVEEPPPRSGRRLGIPVRPEVARYVRYFSAGSQGRSSMVTWIHRASSYAELFRETLEKYHLPQELMAVAFVESGLNPNAVSPAGATGLWQFMTDTARAYDLQVFEEVDERRDPVLATDAAARHLRDLYVEFQDWPLALAAYNAGITRVRDLMAETGSSDFWTIAHTSVGIPQETVGYVPKVLAVAQLLENLSSYGLPPLTPGTQSDAFVTLTVPRPVSVADVASALGLSQTAVRELNPSIVGGQLRFAANGYAVVIPARRMRLAELMLLPDVEGSLSGKLQREVDRLASGAATAQRPAGCVVEPCAPAVNEEDWDRLFRAVGGEGAPRTYVVRKGDTPKKVAELFGVDPDALMTNNGVSDARAIRIGQLLVLPPAPTPL